MNPQSKIDIKEIAKLKEFLGKNPKIIILTHARPDGDAIGSSLGLYEGLKKIGVSVDVACIDACPENFEYLKSHKDLKQDFDSKNYNGFVFVDCGDKHMTQFHKTKPEILDEKTFKINIDHHPSNDCFGDINFLMTDQASASEIVYQILLALKIEIDPSIATALLTGIYTDTGSFMHQNTKAQTYRNAYELVKLGGDFGIIGSWVFHKYSYKKLKLWGKVLENLHLTSDKAAVIGVAQKDYESLGCVREDLDNVIDLISSMPEADYSVLLSEDQKGNVKTSLRTRKNDLDMESLAHRFGGGGHIKASGFTIPKGRLVKEVNWKILKEE